MSDLINGILSAHSKPLHAGSTPIGNHALPLTWKLNAESKNDSLTKKTIHTSRSATMLLSLGISTLLSGLFAPQLVQADIGTWTGASGATWGINANNWTGVSGTPWDSTNGSGNSAIFSSGANATVSGGSNVYVNNITFNANTTLLYTSPPEAVVTLAGANATINAAAGTTSTIKTVLAGSDGLIKTGGGTVVLEPGDGWWSNTFSGPITINGGQLTSIRATSLGDGAGAITINSGGTLSVDWTPVTRTGLVTVNGGTLTTQGGTPQLINNGSGFSFKNGAQINTILGGSGGLTVEGARSYLYSANTYTGATVINAGGDLALLYGGALSTTTALELSGVLLANNKNHTVGGLTGASTGLYYGDAAGTFTVNKVSGTDTYGGIIQNVGTFIKDGAGTLSLTHANNNTTFPGALTVNNGVLELGGAGRFNAGSYNGAISLSSNSSVLQIATSADQALGGAISGSGSLIKSGAGTLTVSGSNSYSGETTVNGGTLTASHANALGDAAGAVTVNSGGLLNVNANMTRTGTVTVNGGELGTGNGSTLTNNGGGFVLTGSSAAAAVVLAGSGGLTVSSPDARLWAQATYSGATTVNSGTLNICGYGGISTNSAVSIASGATVNLTSFYAPENINRTIGGLTGAGVLNGNGGTVTVNKTSGTDTFSGVVSGAQGLIKEGASNLVLAGNNSFSGATTVNLGTLKVASGGSISSSSTTVNNGGTFDVGGTAGNVQVNSGGLLKGSGSVGAFTLASGGSLTPGNSPGTLTAASAIVLGGSSYNWEISALTGTAGTNWDLFSVTGLLNMSDVTSANKWNLVVTGDSGFAGWTDTSSYSYVFAQAASVSGFSSTVGTDVTSLFNITTSGIASKPNASFNVNGDFKVFVGSGTDGNGNQITTLNLMAVPEPSTGAMFVLGLVGLVGIRALKRRQASCGKL